MAKMDGPGRAAALVACGFKFSWEEAEVEAPAVAAGAGEGTGACAGAGEGIGAFACAIGDVGAFLAGDVGGVCLSEMSMFAGAPLAKSFTVVRNFSGSLAFQRLTHAGTSGCDASDVGTRRGAGFVGAVDGGAAVTVIELLSAAQRARAQGRARDVPFEKSSPFLLLKFASRCQSMSKPRRRP